MKNVTTYLTVIIGCLLVAFSFDFFIIPHGLISFGVEGIANIIYNLNDTISPGINMLIIDIILILICSAFVKKDKLFSFAFPSILIAIFVIALLPLTSKISIDLPEMVLVIIVASVISGFGYSLIYKQGFEGGMFFLVEEVLGDLTNFHTKSYSWIVDIILIGVGLILFDYQLVLYSVVIIYVTKYMITKARFGLKDSKMFYIITSKEKEVKDYILHDLKYELTVLDVKGGFTKKHNQILLSVISSGDYYKLKEGIKLIDPKAFIAITDTYDVINKKSF